MIDIIFFTNRGYYFWDIEYHMEKLVNLLNTQLHFLDVFPTQIYLIVY